jgi:hypothetical protein
MAGIRIASSGGLSTGFEARTCLACNPAPCAAACPTGASRRIQINGVFTEVTTWKGKVDGAFLTSLKDRYARRILEYGVEAQG